MGASTPFGSEDTPITTFCQFLEGLWASVPYLHDITGSVQGSA